MEFKSGELRITNMYKQNPNKGGQHVSPDHWDQGVIVQHFPSNIIVGISAGFSFSKNKEIALRILEELLEEQSPE